MAFIEHQPGVALDLRTIRLKKATSFFPVRSKVYWMATPIWQKQMMFSGPESVACTRSTKALNLCIGLKRSLLSRLLKMHFDLWPNGRNEQWRLKVSLTMEGLCIVEA